MGGSLQHFVGGWFDIQVGVGQEQGPLRVVAYLVMFLAAAMNDDAAI